jgi:hypothetical protein
VRSHSEYWKHAQIPSPQKQREEHLGCHQPQRYTHEEQGCNQYQHLLKEKEKHQIKNENRKRRNKMKVSSKLIHSMKSSRRTRKFTSCRYGKYAMEVAQ